MKLVKAKDILINGKYNISLLEKVQEKEKIIDFKVKLNKQGKITTLFSQDQNINYNKISFRQNNDLIEARIYKTIYFNNPNKNKINCYFYLSEFNMNTYLDIMYVSYNYTNITNISHQNSIILHNNSLQTYFKFDKNVLNIIQKNNKLDPFIEIFSNSFTKNKHDIQDQDLKDLPEKLVKKIEILRTFK